MDWEQLRGHRKQREWFRQALSQGRLGSGFLFVGAAGIGKRTFAKLLAKSLFCERVPAARMEPCGTCHGCVQVDAETHADLLLIKKPPDKSLLPLELIVGERDARMQSGLCHDLHMAPQQAHRRIAIIDDGELLTEEASNAMLKTLEEPPKGAVLILIGTSPQKFLPTIRSRCQVVRFDSPTIEEATAILAARGLNATAEQIEATLELAGGDLIEAGRMLDEDAAEFRSQLRAVFSCKVPEAASLARLVSAYVGVAGDDTKAKRERFREAALVAVSVYRHQLRERIEAGESIDEPFTRLERSLLALYHADRNANSATLIESWAVDLQTGTLPA